MGIAPVTVGFVLGNRILEEPGIKKSDRYFQKIACIGIPGVYYRLQQHAKRIAISESSTEKTMPATTTTNATATPNKPAIEFAGSLAVLAACICLVPLLARYAAPLDVWLFYALGIAAGLLVVGVASTAVIVTLALTAAAGTRSRS